MSNGIFGSIRPAKVNSDDVEIFYTYRPSRSRTSIDFNGGFKRLNPSECLVSALIDGDSNISLDGLYTLRLPLQHFNKKGFYTIYIRPKEITHKITDVSVLAAYPDVRGVVLRRNGNLSSLTDLVGYRIELSNGDSRLIKSCNPCEPVIVNTGDGYPKTTRYNLNVTNNELLFCTVTPSSSPTFKPNSKPNIGIPGEDIKIVNTKFSPKVIEVEMVTHDMDTLSYMLEGDQIIDKDNAIITTYNNDKEIYHQADYYTLKDELGTPLYNVRKQRKSIDNNQNYDEIISDNE